MRVFPEYDGPMVDWPHVELIPGADVALMQLRGVYRCSVATNAGASDAVAVGNALARVGIKEYFDGLFTSRDLGANKPSPAFFRAVLQPQRCSSQNQGYGDQYRRCGVNLGGYRKTHHGINLNREGDGIRPGGEKRNNKIIQR